MLISKNKYGRYAISESFRHRPAAAYILRGKVWEPETIEFMIQNCGHEDIVSAGAFFGDFLPALSNAIDEKAKIWAFEPNPESCACAQKTLDLNSINNVSLINAGLGNRVFEAGMLVKGLSRGGSGSCIVESLTDADEFYKVKVIPLDDVITVDRQISILQLDVEYYEKEALEGALKTINRCMPILILEDTLNFIESSWFAETILSIGYKRSVRLHNNVVFKIR